MDNKNEKWKIRPKNFFNCNHLFTWFKTNHTILNKNNISAFNKDYHTTYTKYFKLTPNTNSDIMDELL